MRKCKNCGQDWPPGLTMTTEQKVEKLAHIQKKLDAGETIGEGEKMDHEGTIYLFKYATLDDLAYLRKTYLG